MVYPAIVPDAVPADIPDKAAEVEAEDGAALPATMTEPEVTFVRVIASTLVLFSPIHVRRDVTRESMLLKT